MRTTALLAVLLLSCGPEPVELETTGSATVSVTQSPQAEFPCEVRAVLQAACASCHAGAVYLPGFAARADFLAAQGDGTTFGQRMVGRLTDARSPMPPSGMDPQLTPEQQATLSAWVERGMPAGECGPLTAP